MLPPEVTRICAPMPSRFERVLAASLHILGLTCVMALGFCIALVLNYRVPLSLRLEVFAVYMLGWGITPCFLVLLGALPFLRGMPGNFGGSQPRTEVGLQA